MLTSLGLEINHENLALKTWMATQCSNLRSLRTSFHELRLHIPNTSSRVHDNPWNPGISMVNCSAKPGAMFVLFLWGTTLGQQAPRPKPRKPRKHHNATHEAKQTPGFPNLNEQSNNPFWPILNDMQWPRVTHSDKFLAWATRWSHLNPLLPGMTGCGISLPGPL